MTRPCTEIMTIKYRGIGISELLIGAGRLVSVILAVLLCAGLPAGCRKSAPPDNAPANFDAIDGKMRSCLPPRQYRENDGNIRLAITSLSRQKNETRVRIVAYAMNEAGVFDLPAYSLSRGRWLISEKGRAFLIDQDCRQYRLKGRSAPPEKKLPSDGRISLQPGEAFEADLSFPRLPERPYILMMVYGDLILPLPPLPSGAAKGLR